MRYQEGEVNWSTEHVDKVVNDIKEIIQTGRGERAFHIYAPYGKPLCVHPINQFFFGEGDSTSSEEYPESDSEDEEEKETTEETGGIKRDFQEITGDDPEDCDLIQVWSRDENEAESYYVSNDLSVHQVKQIKVEEQDSNHDDEENSVISQNSVNVYSLPVVQMKMEICCASFGDPDSMPSADIQESMDMDSTNTRAGRPEETKSTEDPEDHWSPIQYSELDWEEYIYNSPNVDFMRDQMKLTRFCLKRVANAKGYRGMNAINWLMKVERKLTQIGYCYLWKLSNSNIWNIQRALYQRNLRLLKDRTVLLLNKSATDMLNDIMREYRKSLRRKDREINVQHEEITQLRREIRSLRDENTEMACTNEALVSGRDSTKSDTSEMALVMNNGGTMATKTIWIADSGASTHMGNDDTGMNNIKFVNIPIKIGNAKHLFASKMGDKHITIIQEDGTTVDCVLKDFQYVPGMWTNLISLTKAMQQNWTIGSVGETLFMTKHGTKVKFDKKLKTTSGFVSGCEVVSRTTSSKGEILLTSLLEKGREVHIQDFHNIMGHPSIDTTEKTATTYGITLIGQPQPCEECALAKSKQANVSKETDIKSNTPGERLFIDISSIQQQSYGGSKFWCLVVDDCTDMCFSFFLKQKSDQVPLLVDFFKDIRAKYSYPVTYIRCDNAGENTALEKACLKAGLGIQFEYTSPNTPQYNGRVERKLAVLYTRCRAILNGAKLTSAMRNGLWAEAAKHATELENTLVTKNKPVAAYTAFYKKDNPAFPHFHVFGEMAIVSYGRDLNRFKPKHLNRGRPCIYLGRSPDHPNDTYRFLNLDTYKIITSRDVAWLGKPYGTWKGLKCNVKHISNNDEDDDDNERDWLTLVPNPTATMPECRLPLQPASKEGEICLLLKSR